MLLRNFIYIVKPITSHWASTKCLWRKVEKGGWGWVLVQGWALINFFYFHGGRLFQVGAYSKVGAYLNKFGISIFYSTWKTPGDRKKLLFIWTGKHSCISVGKSHNLLHYSSLTHNLLWRWILIYAPYKEGLHIHVNNTTQLEFWEHS